MTLKAVLARCRLEVESEKNYKLLYSNDDEGLVEIYLTYSTDMVDFQGRVVQEAKTTVVLCLGSRSSLDFSEFKSSISDEMSEDIRLHQITFRGVFRLEDRKCLDF